MSEPLRPDTLAIHADLGLEPAPDVAPPLHLSTTYAADNPEGLVYSREVQPTRTRLEAVLGALEGGQAVTYASGQAATMAALMHFSAPRVAMSGGGYHGTRLGVESLRRFGVLAVPFSAELCPGDLVWLETPENPTVLIHDIKAHADRAHRAGALLVVDSTFATPVLQQPLSLGADLVMHSGTKFLSGHSDALLGVLVTRDMEVAEALRRSRTVSGSVPGALETWLALRGLRTLPLRVRRESETATRIAGWLSGRGLRVWHPSLAEHPGFEIARRQMSGPPAILSFELATEEAARALPKRLRLIREATSLGGVESLLDWRRRHDAHAPPGLLRLSVGLEEPEDLILDLEQGLQGL